MISTDKTNDSFLTNNSQLYSGDDLVQVEMSVITSDSSYFQAYSYLDNQTTQSSLLGSNDLPHMSTRSSFLISCEN